MLFATFSLARHYDFLQPEGFPSLRLLDGGAFKPGQDVPVLFTTYGQVRIAEFQWGLVPSWGKNGTLGLSRTFAAAESIFQRPSFEKAIRRQRCVVPADRLHCAFMSPLGWESQELAAPNDGVFFMAGIYDQWLSASGEWVSSFALITHRSTPDLQYIAQEIPLILPEHQLGAWLNPETRLESIARLLAKPAHTLKPAPEPENIPVRPVAVLEKSSFSQQNPNQAA